MITEAKRAQRKLESVEKQINKMASGATNMLTCPYCKSQTLYGGTLCCAAMTAAVLAVLDRKEVDVRLNQAEAILEAVEKSKPVVQ